MKKYVMFFLLLQPFLVRAAVYKSAGTGNWNTPTTWVGTPIKPPGSHDTVEILGGYTVTADGSSDSAYVISIASSSTLTMSNIGGTTLNIYHGFVNNGTFSQGSSTSAVIFSASSNQTFTGTGSTNIYAFIVSLASSTDTLLVNLPVTVHYNLLVTTGVLYCGAQINGSGGSGTLTLNNGTSLLLGIKGSATSISFPGGYTSISLGTSSTVSYQANTAQTISTAPTYGNLTLAAVNPTINKSFSSGALTVNGNLLISSCTFTPAASAAITIGGNLTNNGGTISPNSSTITFTSSSAQSIGGSSASTFYNLTLGGAHTVTLGNNQTVQNTLTISSGTTLDVSASSYSLTVGGNFTDNGTFTCRSGIITMNGSVNQTITGPSGGLTLNNLVVAGSSTTDTVYLNPSATFTFALSGLTISQGAFSTQTHSVTASGALSMTGTSATLLLGSKSSTTPIAFPSFGSTSLASTTTVIYQTNGPSTQTVSATPVYGNLVLSSVATGGLKTASSSITVAGNLTISASATFSVTATSLTIGGNLTNNGVYSGTSGTIFNGSVAGTQVIGGFSIITFNSITVSGIKTVSLGYRTVITGNLSLTSGTLDATASNYNLAIGGNFTASGTAMFNPRNDSVIMYGSAPTLGGSTTLNLYNLAIGKSGTTNLTLGGTVTMTGNLNINSGATLNGSTNTLNIAGNFTDDGTFNCNTGTVDFDNNGKQCVSGVHSSETFDNLTVGPLSKLGTSDTINIDGTIFIQPGGQMLCACY